MNATLSQCNPNVYVESFSQSDYFKIIYRMPKGFKYQIA